MKAWCIDDDVLFVGQGAGSIAVECDTGIYQALEEKGIVPGKAYTSSGSTLFGSLYYSDHDTNWMNLLLEKTPFDELIKLSPFHTQRTVTGRGNFMFENTNLKDLCFKYINGEGAKRVLTSVTQVDDNGYHPLMVPAMPGFAVAATSIPFLFRPVVINGKTYVDGGVLNNIPAPTIEEAKKWKKIIMFLAPPTVYPQDSFVNQLLALINAVMDREYQELNLSGFFDLPNVITIQSDSALTGGLLNYSNNFELKKYAYELAKEKLADVDFN